MAQKDIRAPLDRTNRNNHNNNYTQLFEGVRQAKKTLDDLVLESGGDSNAEVVQARGGETTLNRRLDKLDNKDNDLTSRLEENSYQINKKRDKSVPISINDMDEDVLEAIQGGDGTPIEVLSIPRNHSVSPVKTTFFNSTKNLFHGDLVRGFVYDKDNDDLSGQYGEPSGGAKSCIIEIEPNETYTITPYGGDRKIYAVYESYPEYGDDAVELIQGTNKNENPVTFENPSNGNYLVIYLSSQGENIKCQVEKGSASTDYEIPHRFNPDLLESIGGDKLKDASVTKDKTDFIFKTKNLYHGDLVNGFVYDKDNGDLSGKFEKSSGSAVSSIIRIEPHETYTITPYGGDRKMYAVYDSYPEYGDDAVELVQGTNKNENPVTFENPSNGNYLVIYLSSQGTAVKCQVERGNRSTEYITPYRLDELIHVGNTSDGGGAKNDKIKDKYHVYTSFSLDYLPQDQEPANEDGEFNGNTSTHDDIYGLYDGLMNKYPEYITKEMIGEDNYDLPIYSYKFDPPHPRHHDTFPVERMKLLFFSGMHGDERTWPYALFKIMEEVCENSLSHDTLTYLRWCSTIIVTPVINPSGYDDDTRENRDGIDLNRNYEYNWDSEGSGSEPFSEPETQAVKKLIDDNSDAVILLDFHNYFSPRNHLLWAPIGLGNKIDGLTKFINSYFSMLTGRWTQKYEWMPDDEELSRISESVASSLTSYGVEKGMVSHTVEIRDHIPQKPGNKKLDETNIEFAMEYAVNMMSGFINTL